MLMMTCKIFMRGWLVRVGLWNFHGTFDAVRGNLSVPSERGSAFHSLGVDKMSRFHAIIYFLATLCTPLGHADEQLIVVNGAEAAACCDRGGIPIPALKAKNVLVRIAPYDIVRVIKRNGSMVLLCCLKPELRSAWFDTSHFIDQPSFQVINNWKGVPEFELYSEDGGTKRHYVFAKNGTFSAMEVSDCDGNEDCDHQKEWAGRLYRYQQILWARPSGNSRSFEEWSVFQLQQDGTVCIPNMPKDFASIGCP
jgi:hypothetical protein